jgi:CheY-like chemotaxis protein
MEDNIKINLWLIDDDPINNLINKLYMHEVNHRLNISTYDDPVNALEQLKIIKKNEQSSLIPDIILLDINMPKMSGWDFLEAVESDLKQFMSKTDIYMLSSSIASEDLLMAQKRQQIKGYFKKPLDDEFIKSLY